MRLCALRLVCISSSYTNPHLYNCRLCDSTWNTWWSTSYTSLIRVQSTRSAFQNAAPSVMSLTETWWSMWTQDGWVWREQFTVHYNSMMSYGANVWKVCIPKRYKQCLACSRSLFIRITHLGLFQLWRLPLSSCCSLLACSLPGGAACLGWSTTAYTVAIYLLEKSLVRCFQITLQMYDQLIF